MDANRMKELLNAVADVQKLMERNDLLSQVIDDTVAPVELTEEELDLIAAAGTGKGNLFFGQEKENKD